MRNIKLYITTLFMLAMAIACSKDKKITPEITIDFGNIQKNDKNEFVLPNSASTITFTVSSNIDWTASQSGNYNFQISPLSGNEGTSELKITLSPNTSGKERSSILTITAKDLSKTIQIVQNAVTLSINPQTIDMGAEENTQSFNINANTSWSIDKSSLPSWIKSINPLSGTGDSKIEISVNKNTIKKVNSHILAINYAGTSSSIVIKQAAANNNAPSAPSNLSPQEGANSTSVMPTFTWASASDIDGDEISYTVMYSQDKLTWSSLSPVKTNSTTLDGALGLLKANTKYYYKIVADDQFNGKTASEIISFTTGNTDAYENGEYKIYLNSTKANPIKLIFTGDGYTKEHLRYDGLFDKNLNRAIDALFSVEPYKTYKEYFTVYKIAAYSEEAGATVTSKNIKKNTMFKTVIEGGNSTGIKCDYDKVFYFAKRINGVTDDVLYNGGIAVIINEDIYAGTCYTTVSNGKGKCIGMIPVSISSATQMTTFDNVVIHEFGGHGFGRLADEYTKYETEITEKDKQELATWQNWGYSLNVSSTADKAKIPWRRFFDVSGYEHVGVVSGAYYYKIGTYKPEPNSCMIDNRKYFNSQSRYLIVERIMQVANESFSLESFINKDVQKTDNTITKSTKVPYDFRPLGKPIMVIKD